MKYIYVFIFLIIFNYTHANNSVRCDFEEVYQDGSTQFGHLLFNNGLLRYEYKDKQLFTIIYNRNYFIIRNDNQNIVNKLENDDILNQLKFIITNYPDTKNFYTSGHIDINIQNSKEINFLKRVSIKSDKVNLSIHFIDCIFEDISRQYFQPLPLKKIK